VIDTTDNNTFHFSANNNIVNNVVAKYYRIDDISNNKKNTYLSYNYSIKTSISKDCILARNYQIDNSKHIKPIFEEDDVFTITVPLTEDANSTEQVTEQVTEQAILDYCIEAKSTKEIMGFLKLKHREHFRAEILKPLLERGLLKLTIPEKPRSSKQKYYSVNKHK